MSDASNSTNRPSQDSNGLGIAGFVVSLIGLCSGGLVSPIGLILSLVALGKQPKGFAIAGAILGAIGSCGIILGLVFLPVAIAGILVLLGFTAAAIAIGGPDIEAKVEMGILTAIVEKYADEHDAFPLTLDQAEPNITSTAGLRNDSWNTPYFYQLNSDATAYRIFSAGPDKIPGTPDDIFLDNSDAKGWPTPTAPATTTPPAPETPATTSDEPAPE